MIEQIHCYRFSIKQTFKEHWENYLSQHRNIIKRRQRTNNLERRRWQSRNLRIKKPLDEIESLVLSPIDISSAELGKIEKKVSKC